jgi:CheY-like chemotaxis protein
LELPKIEGRDDEKKLENVTARLKTLSRSDPIKVVYVEDNATNLRLMESFFDNEPGVNLYNAISAEIGLRLVNEVNPAVVLLDLSLPDRYGLDVLKDLKSAPKTQSIPVIVITADATEATQRAVMAAGASAYISKPIDFSKLMDELSRFAFVTKGGR